MSEELIQKRLDLLEKVAEVVLVTLKSFETIVTEQQVKILALEAVINHAQKAQTFTHPMDKKYGL